MTDLNIANSQTTGIPATGGTYTFWVARDDIIREAMMNLGLLEQDEQPTPQEVTDCARKLNMAIKQLAGGMDKAPGFKMWQRMRADLFLGYSKYLYRLGATGDNWAGGTTGVAFPALYNQQQLVSAVAQGGTVLPVPSITGVNIGDQLGIQIANDITWLKVSGLAAGQIQIAAPGLPAAAGANAYVWNYTTKGQRPVEIITGLLRDIYGTDTPLTKMTLEVYEALPTKTQPGFVQDPMAWYYEPRATENVGNLYIDCAGAQDVTKHLHFVYLRQVQDYNNPNDATDFPQEWFNHLCWTLSLNICGMFDADWTPDRQAAYLLATMPAREANPQESQLYFQAEAEDAY